jgi:hypothetical protein
MRKDQPASNGPFGNREEKELLLTRLIGSRLAEIARRYPQTKGMVEDIFTEIICVTIDG